VSVRRCETGTLELGGGLEVLVSAALETLAPGEELDVVTESRGSAYELPAWARITGHEVVDERQERAEDGRRFVVRLRRGSLVRVLGDSVAGGHDPPTLTAGSFATCELRRIAGPAPADADPAAGLIPIGAAAEPGAPDYHWPLNRRDAVWSTGSPASRTRPHARSGTPPPIFPGKPHTDSSPTSNERWPR